MTPTRWRRGSTVARYAFLFGSMLCSARDDATAQDGGGYRGLAVSVTKAEEKCFQDRLQVSGILAPKTEIKVWPERGGLQISQVLIEPGDSVGAGQVLARLVEPVGALPQTVAVRSPVTGLAVGVLAVVGSYASPSTTDPLFRIIVDDELEMHGEVLASVLPQLKIGQTATLQIIGFGPLQGHVESIRTSIDPMTQLGSVVIAFTPDPRLRPGAFARAEVDAGQKCAVTVPLSAVLYGGGGDVVQVVRGDRVETRRVDTGLLQDGLVQILEGVDPGDIVIERAGSFLREGDRVRPILPDGASKP